MGRTRGSGEGSIYKNGKTWRGQIIIGGRRLSVSGKTRKEVSARLAEVKTKELQGIYIEPNGMLVEDWISYWLKIKKEPRLTTRSYEQLVGQFETHIIPYLGKYRVQELSRIIIENAFIESFDDKKYATNTVMMYFRNFKSCIQYAVDCELLLKNPCAAVEINPHEDSKKISAYTPGEQEKLIHKCKYGNTNERFYYFLICTGLRFCEAAALMWDDIDLDTGMIKITKSSTVENGSSIIQYKTKTKAGLRTIYVGENVIEWLKWHKKTSSTINPKNLLFQNTQHGIMCHSTCSNALKLLCENLDIDYRGMHAFRHTWATRAMESKVDIKVVSEMLGHSDVTTTMNIYQDVLDNQKIKAACTLNAQY